APTWPSTSPAGTRSVMRRSRLPVDSTETCVEPAITHSVSPRPPAARLIEIVGKTAPGRHLAGPGRRNGLVSPIRAAAATAAARLGPGAKAGTRTRTGLPAGT